MLPIGIYPYNYMDGWEKFNETSLPEKEDFCNDINMENITNADYMHPKRVCKDFEIKIFRRLFEIICMLKVIHYC